MTASFYKDGYTNESSANTSQNLAESLLDFTNDDSFSICETTTTRPDNINVFEIDNTEYNLTPTTPTIFTTRYSRFPWKGSLTRIG